MNFLNNQLTTFEYLHTPLIGNILDQLNQITRGEEVNDKLDIKFVIRYTRHLVCTSKKMAEKINQLDVVNIFLKSLSDKYNKPLEDCAALLNTIGARQWIWNYIKKNGDDKNYQIIQDIRELASNVLKEAKNVGITFEDSEMHVDDWVYYHNPHGSQVKQGFAFYNQWSPTHMATPLGLVHIYHEKTSIPNYFYLSLAEVFIKKLNAVFDGLTNRYGDSPSKRDRYKVVEITDPLKFDTIRKINPEEMRQVSKNEWDSKKGTQNLIVIEDLLGIHSRYKIKEVNGNKIPDLIEYDLENPKRSPELLTIIWEMLYTHQLGKDPITEKNTWKKRNDALIRKRSGLPPID